LSQAGRDGCRDEGRVGERGEFSLAQRDDASQEGRVEVRDEEGIEGGGGEGYPPDSGYLQGGCCNSHVVSVLVCDVMFRAFQVSNPVEAHNGGAYEDRPREAGSRTVSFIPEPTDLMIPGRAW
jgi:hypothetical protein